MAANPQSIQPSAPLLGGGGEEVGVDGLYAEVAHDYQCSAEERGAVADGTSQLA